MITDIEVEVSTVFDKLLEEAKKNNQSLGVALIDEYGYELPVILSTKGEKFVKKLQDMMEQYLLDHDLCNVCGFPLEFHHYTEYHPEVDAYEPMCDAYCPNCGGY